jgi:hypothetical protein
MSASDPLHSLSLNRGFQVSLHRLTRFITEMSPTPSIAMRKFESCRLSREPQRRDPRTGWPGDDMLRRAGHICASGAGCAGINVPPSSTKMCNC